MKTYFSTTIYLLLLFSFGNSLSQTAIRNKDYEVTDDVIKIEEVVFKESKTTIAENLNYMDMYDFDKGYITGKIRIIEDKAQDQQVYLYNNDKKEFSFENYNETYGDYKAQHQLITFNHLKFYYPKTDFVVIQNKPNILLEFSYTIHDRKITHKFEKQADNFITDTYNDYGNHVDTYNSIGQKVKTETISLSQSDLTYSTDGLIETTKTIYGKYVDRPTYTYHSYEKDKKGNWVKKVIVTERPDNGIMITFAARKITYANGEVTGSVFYDSTFVLWEFALYGPDIKYSANRKPTTTNSTTIPNGLVWKKNDANTDYFLYNNAIRISGEGVTFYVDNHLFVYLTLKNEIYKLKDLKTLTANDYHEAELLPFKPTNGVWFKEAENKFRVYDANGKQINEVEINKYAQNGIDIIIKGKNQEKTLLLKNYKNATLNTVYASEIYIVENYETTNNASASTTIPNGLVWKKNNENTEVWLYENGVEIDGTVFFVDNTLYFYETKNDNIYKLENFNAQTANSFHNAIALPSKYPHGTWMRWDAQGGVNYVNSEGKIVNSNTIFKNAANNIDVIYKGTGETETLLFKGFKNATIKAVNPAEIYNPSKTSTSTSSNIKETAKVDSYISDCKSQEKEANCLVQKIEDDLKTLQSQGKSQVEINNFLEDKTKMLGNYNVDLLYSTFMAFEYNSTAAKLIMPLIKKLPQNQQNRIKELSNKTIDNYSNQQSEYLAKKTNNEIAVSNKKESELETNTKTKTETLAKTTGCITGNCGKGIGIYVWESGNKYEGQWLNENMNGKGTMWYKTGSIYKGDWVDGVIEGKGEYIWENGTKYEGQWKASKNHGIGTKIYYNGDVYKGDFIDGEANGKGEYIWKSGNKYEGQWLNGKMHGKGIRWFNNGSIYKGDWENDERKGKGVLTWSNGDGYTGEFDKNEMSGKGVYLWNSGAKYDGNWLNGNKHGNGKEYDVKGELLFEGEYIDGERFKSKD